MARAWFAFVLVFLLAALSSSCTDDYKNDATTAGQQTAIEQANDFLTAGDCGSAINVLKPLVDQNLGGNDVLMVYASAYACQGGISFPSIIGNLKNLNGQDVWGVLIKSDYSSGSGDGHVSALDTATNIIFATATPAGNQMASQRTDDANVYVVFIQAIDIASVISPLGNANSGTGKKGNSITNLGSTSDKCHVQVGAAIILDSLNYVKTGSAIDNMSNSIKSLCASLPGGSCPTNTDFATCMHDATFQAGGQLLINAIDTQWN